MRILRKTFREDSAAYSRLTSVRSTNQDCGETKTLDVFAERSRIEVVHDEEPRRLSTSRSCAMAKYF